MSLRAQAREVARIDLVVERRVGDTLRIVLPFAVVALMIFSLATPSAITDLGDIGIAVFWGVAVLYGMQIALRISASETARRREVMSLIGLDPAARFLGRSFASAMMLMMFMTVLLVFTVVLFDPDLPDAWLPTMLLVIVLAASGLAMLSTLAGEVAGGLRNKSALASLIVAPLVVPVVVGASQTLESMNQDNGILLWILLLITTDLVLLTAGIGLSRPLEEASR